MTRSHSPLKPLHLAASPSRQHGPQASTETAGVTLSHLDWSYLHILSDSDHDFEITLLELFLQDCQEQLEQLKEAIAQSNVQQIEKLAHYIKGASANVGAQYMHYYAQEIEHRARHTQPTCFDTEISRLETSLGIVYDMFSRKLAG